MAFGDTYALLNELKDYLELPGAPDTSKDARLNSALASATREIENHCHRQFNKSNVTEVRTYTPNPGGFSVFVDDFYDVDSLVVQTVSDSFGVGTAWNANDFVLEPENGVVNGRPGWPYDTIAIRPRGWATKRLCVGDRVRVTAKFGWAAVPEDVHQACLILAAANFKLSSAPLGVAGFNQGMGVVRVKDSALGLSKLCDYVKDGVMVA
jgi:hypothetical protein